MISLPINYISILVSQTIHISTELNCFHLKEKNSNNIKEKGELPYNNNKYFFNTLNL